MENVIKAQDILAEVPLPEDAEDQIERLFEAASEDEKPFFDMIFEGLFVAQQGTA